MNGQPIVVPKLGASQEWNKHLSRGWEEESLARNARLERVKDAWKDVTQVVPARKKPTK